MCSPRSMDLSTRLPPMYIVLGACADRKYGVSQLKRTSEMTLSATCFDRNAAIRRVTCADAGVVVSPRATTMESSYWPYISRYDGLRSCCRSPDTKTSRPNTPPCD